MMCGGTDTARDATLADLEIVASWPASPRACELWAGPKVTYPLVLARLQEEIEWEAAQNLVLQDEVGVVGFGQLVPRGVARVHVARVIVRPGARGRGAGRALCSALLERAVATGYVVATLNVYDENTAARRLYESLGFVAAGVPGGATLGRGLVAMSRSLVRGDGVA